jgi:hypothetical protein
MGDLISGIAGLLGEGEADPQTRDLASEIRTMLEQGPALLRSQQQLTPQYTQLRLQTLQDMLRGTPGGTRSVTSQTPTQAWYNIRTGETRATRPEPSGLYGSGPFGDFRNGGTGGADEWVSYQTLVPNTTEVATPATRGLLDIYGEDIMPALTEAETAATTARRSANMGDLATLGPGAVANMKALDPESAALYESLQADAAAGLAAGDRLTSDQQFNVTNPIRSSYASRGFSPGAMEGLEEGINLFGAGNALGQQRRGQAAGVAALGQSLYTNPALNWLSPGSTVAGAGQSFLGYGGSSPSVLDQLGGYGSSLFGQNSGNMQSTEFWNAKNTQDAWGNIASGVNDVIGGIGMMCWAAREIFGVADPRWLTFRAWMLDAAPDKLRQWYRVNGERWAGRLKHASAGTRAAVQRWMERRIQLCPT